MNDRKEKRHARAEVRSCSSRPNVLRGSIATSRRGLCLTHAHTLIKIIEAREEFWDRCFLLPIVSRLQLLISGAICEQKHCQHHVSESFDKSELKTDKRLTPFK